MMNEPITHKTIEMKPGVAIADHKLPNKVENGPVEAVAEPGALAEKFAVVERAKQEWESTVDALPELICVVGEDGRVLRTNLTVETWQLSRVVDVKGRTWHDVIHPWCQSPTCELKTFWQEAKRRALAADLVEHEIYDHYLRRHILIHVRPVVDNLRQPTGRLVVILHDVSRQKETERALNRNTSRLETMNAISRAILTAHLPEEILSAALNRIWTLVPFDQAIMLLYEPGTESFDLLAADAQRCAKLTAGTEAMYQWFREAEPEELGRIVLLDNLQQLSSDSPLEQQLIADGMLSCVRVPLMADSERLGFLCLAAEKPRIFGREEIEVVREVAEILTVAMRQSQLYKRLKQTNEELQHLLRARHEMMQNVSHDLRSPIALIQGYTELLTSEAFGPLTAEQQEALQILDSKGEQLYYMVNRLMTLQTLDRDTLEKTPVSPYALLLESVQSWQLPASNNHMRIELEVDPVLPSVWADVNLLNQVLSNLLDNAIKYSPEGGLIRVTGRCRQDNLVIAVSDEGMGISAAKLDRIFERFYQVKRGESPAKDGVGIGLALCQAIADAHDGRLWAESPGEGQGSTFYLSLPLELETE